MAYAPKRWILPLLLVARMSAQPGGGGGGDSGDGPGDGPGGDGPGGDGNDKRWLVARVFKVHFMPLMHDRHSLVGVHTASLI